MGQVVKLAHFAKLGQHCTEEGNDSGAVLVAVEDRFDNFVGLDEILFCKLFLSFDEEQVVALALGEHLEDYYFLEGASGPFDNVAGVIVAVSDAGGGTGGGLHQFVCLSIS